MSRATTDPDTRSGFVLAGLVLLAPWVAVRLHEPASIGEPADLILGSLVLAYVAVLELLRRRQQDDRG